MGLCLRHHFFVLQINLWHFTALNIEIIHFFQTALGQDFFALNVDGLAHGVDLAKLNRAIINWHHGHVLNALQLALSNFFLLFSKFRDYFGAELFLSVEKL